MKGIPNHLPLFRHETIRIPVKRRRKNHNYSLHKRNETVPTLLIRIFSLSSTVYLQLQLRREKSHLKFVFSKSSLQNAATEPYLAPIGQSTRGWTTSWPVPRRDKAADTDTASIRTGSGAWREVRHVPRVPTVWDGQRCPAVRAPTEQAPIESKRRQNRRLPENTCSRTRLPVSAS